MYAGPNASIETVNSIRHQLGLDRPFYEQYLVYIGRVLSGVAGRAYLDRVQIRHEAAPLTIPPLSGILTSCSMYLKEHFVVLNQGAGNFGIHTAAVLLNPIKTFGTNIMLEIYNTGDQPVVNPVVSVEVFRAPEAADPEYKAAAKRRTRLLGTASELYKCLDENPARENGDAKPRTKITVKGQTATIRKAVEMVRDEDLADHIDLNFGCPVPKVTRRGGGAALPYKRALFGQIVHTPPSGLIVGVPHAGHFSGASAGGFRFGFR